MGSGIIRYLISIFGGIFFILFMACARPAPILTPLTLPELSKEEIIAVLKKKSINFSSLKSLVKIKIKFPGERKMKKQSFDGALLCKDSGEFRLQALGFFNRTLFDLLYKPNEMTLYIPSSSVAYKGVPGQFKDFNDADVFLILRKIIIGIGENYDENNFYFEEDVYSPWIDKGKRNYFLLKINRKTLFVDKKIVFQDGKILAEVFYQGYKQLEEKPFPTHIKIFFPSPKVTIEFYIDSLILNEELPDRLFILSLPSDIKWFPLSKLPIDFLSNPAT